MTYGLRVEGHQSLSRLRLPFQIHTFSSQPPGGDIGRSKSPELGHQPAIWTGRRMNYLHLAESRQRRSGTRFSGRRSAILMVQTEKTADHVRA